MNISFNANRSDSMCLPKCWLFLFYRILWRIRRLRSRYGPCRQMSSIQSWEFREIWDSHCSCQKSLQSNDIRIQSHFDGQKPYSSSQSIWFLWGRSVLAYFKGHKSYPSLMGNRVVYYSIVHQFVSRVCGFEYRLKLVGLNASWGWWVSPHLL